MRVVLLGPYPEEGQPVRGGIAAVLGALVPALVRRLGGGVTVVGPGAEDADTGERAGEPRVIRIAEEPGIRGWFREHRRYRQCLASLNYDILHVQDPVHAKAADFRRTPVVFTPHGRGKEEAAFMEGRMRLQQRYWVGHVLASTAKRSAAAVAISGYQRAWLERLGVSRVESIPDPVAPEFVAEETGGEPVKGCLLYVGGIIPRKGLLDLAKALHIVTQSRGEAHLRVAGAGEKPTSPYAHLVQEFIAAHDLRSHVEWLGQLPSAELIREYADCMACVVTSLHETFGLGAAQALGCGRPAIVYDIPGVRDVVLHEETGLRVPLEAGPEGLADAMHRLLEAPDEAAEMGRRGRAHVLANFHPDIVAAQTVALYEDVVEGMA